MDYNFPPNHIFPPYHIHEPPIPRDILSEPTRNTYLVAWHSDPAGVVYRDPEPINKDVLAAEFPAIVSVWEAKQRHERREAKRIEQKFLAFATQEFYAETYSEWSGEESEEVDCDRNLRPGMGEHWGEVRKCATHPDYRLATWVCKGCRVAHYAQRSTKFDRPLLMTRGARVPACRNCADKAMEKYKKRDEEGVKFKECKCDVLWTCFRCREEELERLAEAREEYHKEECCGKCEVGYGDARHVEFCLYCEGWRVYAASDEEVVGEGGDEDGEEGRDKRQFTNRKGR
jgi:hypothetical protein